MNEIGDAVVRNAIEIHQALEPGLLESIHEATLVGEALMKDGITRIINGRL